MCHVTHVQISAHVLGRQRGAGLRKRLDLEDLVFYLATREAILLSIVCIIATPECPTYIRVQVCTMYTLTGQVPGSGSRCPPRGKITSVHSRDDIVAMPREPGPTGQASRLLYCKMHASRHVHLYHYY